MAGQYAGLITGTTKVQPFPTTAPTSNKSTPSASAGGGSSASPAPRASTSQPVISGGTGAGFSVATEGGGGIEYHPDKSSTVYTPVEGGTQITQRTPQQTNIENIKQASYGQLWQSGNLPDIVYKGVYDVAGRFSYNNKFVVGVLPASVSPFPVPVLAPVTEKYNIPTQTISRQELGETILFAGLSPAMPSTSGFKTSLIERGVLTPTRETFFVREVKPVAGSENTFTTATLSKTKVGGTVDIYGVDTGIVKVNTKPYTQTDMGITITNTNVEQTTSFGPTKGYSWFRTDNKLNVVGSAEMSGGKSGIPFGDITPVQGRSFGRNVQGFSKNLKTGEATPLQVDTSYFKIDVAGFQTPVKAQPNNIFFAGKGSGASDIMGFTRFEPSPPEASGGFSVFPPSGRGSNTPLYPQSVSISPDLPKSFPSNEIPVTSGPQIAVQEIKPITKNVLSTPEMSQAARVDALIGAETRALGSYRYPGMFRAPTLSTTKSFSESFFSKGSSQLLTVQSTQSTNKYFQAPSLGPNVLTVTGTLSKGATLQAPAVSQSFITPQVTMQTPSFGTPQVPVFVPVIRTPEPPSGGGGGGFLPSFNLESSRSSRKFGAKRRPKYTPSFEAFVFNIRGKAPKGTLTGLETRPITKGFSFAYGNKAPSFGGGLFGTKRRRRKK